MLNQVDRAILLISLSEWLVETRRFGIGMGWDAVVGRGEVWRREKMKKAGCVSHWRGESGEEKWITIQ